MYYGKRHIAKHCNVKNGMTEDNNNAYPTHVKMRLVLTTDSIVDYLQWLYSFHVKVRDSCNSICDSMNSRMMFIV